MSDAYTSNDTEEFIDLEGMRDLLSFTITARRNKNVLQAFVFLGGTIVFTMQSTRDQYAAGLRDFANIATRRFAERLRDTLLLRHDHDS